MKRKHEDVTKRKIGKEEVKEAAEWLKRYKEGKATLEARIVEDEQWWKLRHRDFDKQNKKSSAPEAVSAWLFNTLINKHADAMDNFPEASILPRERNDIEEAKKLSSILPCVLEHNDYEEI